MVPLICGIYKQTKNKEPMLQGAKDGGNRERLVKGHKFSL